MGKINRRSGEFKKMAIDFYMANDMSRDKVCEKFGCSTASLNRWAKKLKRYDYTEKAALCGVKHVNLNESQRQIIMGSLLGDACIHCRRKSRRRRTISFGHSINQLNYLRWKHTMLKSANKLSRYTTGYGSIGYRFTFTHPFVEELHQHNYKNDVKNISLNWIKDLDALGLAVWYQDDGSLAKAGKYITKAGIKKYSSIVIRFSTHSFDETSITNIVNGLGYHGFKSFVVRTAKGPVVSLSSRPARAFIEHISSHVMLRYKIGSARNSPVVK